MRSSVIRLHHPAAVRTAAFSCSQACPVHAVVGLNDNGCLYRLVVVTIITLSAYPFSLSMTSRWVQNDSLTVYPSRTRVPFSRSTGPLQREVHLPGAGGWIASGSLDRTVKVWDLTNPHFERTPTYTIATQFPVRRVRWRPGYECELAVTSNAESGTGSMSDIADSGTVVDVDMEKPEVAPVKGRADIGDSVEIWDVRRGHIAKWRVGGSSIEGGVTGTSPFYA